MKEEPFQLHWPDLVLSMELVAAAAYLHSELQTLAPALWQWIDLVLAIGLTVVELPYWHPMFFVVQGSGGFGALGY